MAPLEASKGDDSLVKARIQRSDYLIYGGPTYANPLSYVSYATTAYRCIGAKRETQFNRTKYYKPGTGTMNPIIHYKNSGKCAESDMYLYAYVYGRKYKTRRVQGPLAAFCQGVSSTTFRAAQYPGTEELDALVKATGNALSGKVNLAVTIGELPETLGMMHGPISKLVHYGKKFRKLLPRNARASLEAVTNAWLAVRYGVLPAMGEIDDYRQLIKDGLSQRLGDILKEKAGFSRDVQQVSTAFVRDSGFGYLHGEETIKTGSKIAATVLYRKVTNTWSDVLGVNVRSIPLAVWELIPYSFVVDWFIDVGAWLSSVTPNNSVTIVNTALSLKSFCDAYCTVSGCSQNPAPTATYPMTHVTSQFEFKSEAYVRSVNLSLPAVPLVNGRSLGVLRQIDSVSLALQRAKNLFSIRR